MVLDRLLQKMGVSNFLDLNEQEKKTYKEWQQALAGRRITDDDTARFLAVQLEDSLKKITTMKLGKRDDTFLKMKIQFIRDVQNFLNAPALEKKMAEAGLERMLATLP